VPEIRDGVGDKALCQLSYATQAASGLEPETTPLKVEVTDACAPGTRI
jgi:hypothetical protein